MKHKINFIYEVGIIDYWESWTPLFNKPELPLSIPTIKALSYNLFSMIIDFIRMIPNHDLRENGMNGVPELYFYKDESFGAILLGFKADDNGTTYIASDTDLTVGFAADDAFLSLMDVSVGCDCLSQIYPFPCKIVDPKST